MYTDFWITLKVQFDPVIPNGDQELFLAFRRTHFDLKMANNNLPKNLGTEHSPVIGHSHNYSNSQNTVTYFQFGYL